MYINLLNDKYINLYASDKQKKKIFWIEYMTDPHE